MRGKWYNRDKQEKHVFSRVSRLIQFRHEVLCEVGKGRKQPWDSRNGFLIAWPQSYKRAKFDKEVELAEDGKHLSAIRCDVNRKGKRNDYTTKEIG